MKIYLLIMFCFLSAKATSQINQVLKEKLDSVYALDQKYRAYMAQISQNSKLADSLTIALNAKENLEMALWDYQNRIDRSNLVLVEKIIKKHGYPGISMVGKPTSDAAWHVIQHSPKIGQYFPIIQRAGRTKELAFTSVAMMQDRLLTEQRKPQLYGTQAACYPLKNVAVNNQGCFIWPVTSPKEINQRRKKAGFTTTVEENAERLGLTYKVLTMENIRKTYNLGN